MKHTKENRKIHVVNEAHDSLLGKSVEICHGGNNLDFELYLGEDLIAYCRLAEPLEKWAFHHGAEKVVTLPQANWSGDQE